MNDSSHTNSKKYHDEKTKIYTVSPLLNQPQQLDTSITNFHHLPFINYWEKPIGGLGTPTASLKYSPFQSIQPQFYFSPKLNYFFTWENTLFYNTTKPYTSLYYSVATKQEQLLQLLHTRNVNSHWNFSAEYTKLNTPGVYKLQKANHDLVRLTTYYISPNQQYELKTAFIYNKLQQDENGGIQSTAYLGNSKYNDKRLIPVAFEPYYSTTKNKSLVTNFERSTSIHLSHRYSLGKKDSVYNADSSIATYAFTPHVSIFHLCAASFQKYAYKDKNPDSIRYLPFSLPSFSTSDSVYTNTYLSTLKNECGLESTLKIKKIKTQTSAVIGLDIDRFENLYNSSDYKNAYLCATLNSTHDTKNSWAFNGLFKFYFSGYAKGNTLLSLACNKQIQNSKLEFRFKQFIQSAPYLFTSFQTNYYTQQHTFSKQQISQYTVSYTNDNYSVNANLNYYLLFNYFYLDSLLQPTQYKPLSTLPQLQVSKTLHYKNWNLLNTILLQTTSSKIPIQVPLFIHSISLFYQNIILQHLLVSSGVECTYNSPYKPYSYSPLRYQFIQQNDYTLYNIPTCHIYFNFTIKQFRAYIMLREAQQIFTKHTNQNYPFYPTANTHLKFGFNWIFIN